MTEIDDASFVALYEVDPESAESTLRRVIRGEDTMRALSLCLILKEKGHVDAAARNLKLLQVSHPEEPAISFELGVLLFSRDPTSAANELQKALSLVPDFVSAFRCLAMLYLSTDSMDLFYELLNNFHESEAMTLEVVSEFSRLHCYLSNLPPSPISSASPFMNALGYGVTDAKVDRTFKVIMQALSSSDGFALVRYGDGEGALWHAPKDEEMRNFAEYRQQRSYFSHRWFGEDYRKIKSDIDLIGSKTAELLPTADVLAAPSVDWIKHEGEACNVRAFRCCVNAARAVRVAKLPTARTSIHFDLLDSGGLAEIVNFSRPICVVTSHRTIAALIEHRFSRQLEVEQIIIPPAFSDLEVTKYVLSKRTYQSINSIISQAETLSRDYVMLVGAGYVGKLVCLKLKYLGFFAIDVGSVFDLVLKLQTRPNFSLYNPDVTFREEASFIRPAPLNLGLAPTT